MSLSIANCEVLEQIYESQNSLVYTGVRQADNVPVILKVLKQSYPTPAELARYKQEYHITRKLELAGVIKVYSLETYEHSLVMVLEDFGAKSLKKLFEGRILPISEFLTIAIRIAGILGKIHAAKVIHKDINPSNIVLNQRSGELKIIDFSISSELSREATDFGSTTSLEGTLAYIAPEQTGRMNRNIDYRSDFYSLGVTFYQLLTGKLPFEGNDPLEIIYGHMAKQPVSPQELRPELPEIFSTIVLKLVAKNAEDRYQSAYGLKADLERVQTQLSAGETTAFPLGEADVAGQFRLPQKLYGRETEINQLLSAFEQASAGANVIMLVKGYAGIGKSALIKEVHKPITEKKGYFVEGKFDQFQRNSPYLGIGKALNQLCRYILTERPESIDNWQTLLVKALGKNAQVVVDLVPDLALIIGKQPVVPKVGVNETQNRLLYTFEKFLSALSNAERPLTIFIDDLQWADAASLRLLELIGTSSEISHMLVVGAYRDNEVDETHPFQNTLKAINAVNEIVEIRLSPLAIEAVTLLVADTLSATEEAVKPLVELITRKTEGNPFFVGELMQHLYEGKLLWFDLNIGEWVWETKAIAETKATTNVVTLLLEKMKKLDQLSQAVLMYGACLGHTFKLSDLNNLGLIETSNQTKLSSVCVALVNGGFIDQVKKGKHYRFVHDQVQQAAYALLPKDSRACTHKLIGEAMLARISEQEKEARLFEIADHLNQGANLLEDEAEKVALAKLNLEAGQRSRLAIAYQESLNYLKKGILLLPEDAWMKTYSLSLSLYEGATEASYLSSDFKAMEKYVEIILENSKDILDSLKVYEIAITAYTHQGRHLEAISFGRKVLSKLGFRLPNKVTLLQVMIGFIKTQFLLRGKSIDTLSNLPQMKNKQAQGVLRIITSLARAISQQYPNLYAFIPFTALQCSLKHGNDEQSPFGYAIYGIILSEFKQGAKAYMMGQLALHLLDKSRNSVQRGRVKIVVALYISYRQDPMREGLRLLKQGLENAWEEGDTEYVVYIASAMPAYKFFIGKNLPEVEQDFHVMAKLIAKTQNQSFPLFMNFVQQTIHKLRHVSMADFVGEPVDESDFPALKAQENLFPLFLFRSIMHYILGEYEQAQHHVIKARKHIPTPLRSIYFAIFHLFEALNQLALYSQVSKKQQKTFLKQIKSNLNQLNDLAKHAPMNFQNKCDLIAAELARLSGKEREAIKLYQKSIAEAKENELIHEEAIANERAGEFYFELELEAQGISHISQAHYLYTHWGATTKVKQLEKTYPQLVTEIDRQRRVDASNTRITTNRTGSLKENANQLDIISLIKASQTLSGEVKLESLISKLMHIVMENAGAQRAALLLNKSGDWFIEAASSIDADQAEILQGKPAVTDLPDDALPKSIINYLIRTGETVVLDNAYEEGDFTEDPCIKIHRSKSLLVLPIKSQGKLIGMLSLQNFNATGVFTPDRLQVLETIASQAAISLENTSLYENLENLVAERTEELSYALKDLQKAQGELIKAKEMAETAREAAETANKAKSTFLANMSHELRTPLNSILGFSQLLQRGANLSRQETEHLATINRSGEHLLGLINDVLEVAKIEAGKITVNVTTFNLFKLIEELEQMFRIRTNVKDLFFTIEVAKSVIEYVKCDEGKLRQILINLLENAVKFTERGGISLRVHGPAKDMGNVGSPAGSICLFFEIEDTGIGIAKSEIGLVFQEFGQTTSGRNAGAGTGLGMPITKKYVNLLGGDISLESELGKGTVFRFTIDVRVASESEVPKQETIGRVRSLQKGEKGKYRILIADDVVENRKLLKQLLEPVGFLTRSTVNGKEALTQFQHWQPHLILMDCKMPEMDGLKAIRAIRAIPEGEKLPILSISASVFGNNEQEALDAGANDFLGKPVQEHKLFGSIKKWLDVDYIYDQDEIPVSPSDPVELTQESLKHLPKPLIEQLRQSIEIGDYHTFTRLLNGISNHEDQTIKALRSLADAYEHEKLLALLES